MNRKMYARNTLLILFLASMLFCSCLGGGSGGDGGQNSDPPKVAILPQEIEISIPQNLPQTFSIFNTGGGKMDYLVADDGSLAGFLDIQNASGSVSSGQSQSVLVSGKPVLYSETGPSMVGAQLVLSVYTPDAANYIKSLVTVHIISTEITVESASCTFMGTDSSGFNLFQLDYSGTATGAVNDYLSVGNDGYPGGSYSFTCPDWSGTGTSGCTRLQGDPLQTQWSRQGNFISGSGPGDTSGTAVIDVKQNGNVVTSVLIPFFCQRL